MREVYLPAFEHALCSQDTSSVPKLVMAAYNKVNGVYCCENKYLLGSILRDEWKYDGVVVSDWGAILDRSASLRAGMDLEMPGTPSTGAFDIEVLEECESEQSIMNQQQQHDEEQPMVMSSNRSYSQTIGIVQTVKARPTMDAAIATMERTSDSLDPPSGYKAVVVLALVICSIASLLSLILLVATTTPLLWRRRRRRYSTYNLYLAYLAIPDLVISSFVVYLILSSHTGGFDPIETSEDAEQTMSWMFDHPGDHGIYALCVSANLYTNSFLVYEIYELLKDSNRRKRHRPPSITKVTKQALCSYSVGVFLFLLDFFVDDKFDDDSKQTKIWFGLYQAFSFIVCVGIPLSVLVFISLRINQQGLIDSTGSMYNGRLRVLVIYFARIVANYLLVWIPASTSYMVYWSLGTSGTKVMAYAFFLVLNGCQPIINFGLALTKQDAHKLVADLFTCEYCRHHQELKNDRESSTFSVDAFLGADRNMLETTEFLRLSNAKRIESSEYLETLSNSKPTESTEDIETSSNSKPTESTEPNDDIESTEVKLTFE